MYFKFKRNQNINIFILYFLLLFLSLYAKYFHYLLLFEMLKPY